MIRLRKKRKENDNNNDNNKYIYTNTQIFISKHNKIPIYRVLLFFHFS